MDAVISACKKYRHLLRREVNSKGEGTCVFIMLNPSTADANSDDPTIRKCKGFTDRLGYSSLCVVNLFDFRATDPKILKSTANPCSIENLAFIRREVRLAKIVICAWGNHGIFQKQNKKVLNLLAEERISAHALELTKVLNPKHPLYVSYDRKPFAIT